MTVNGLPASFRIEEFEFVRPLGEGGFGITYLGWDHNLDKPVAIKEYFPEDWAGREESQSVRPLSQRYEQDFDWGKERFLAEAKTLARFNHPNVVKAYRYFEANQTGYIVMEYVEGQPLEAIIENGKTLDAEAVRFILEHIAAGLDSIHAVEFLHRDIKPANVIMSAETGEPILIDFGAARQTVSTKTAALTAIVTPGYGPHEQYSVEGDNQGPWTDIYSLCALGYKALTGITPPEGNGRFENDTFRPLDEAAFGDEPLCKAINAGLKVITTERPRSAREWLILAASDTVESLPQDARSRKSKSARTNRKRAVAGAPRTIKPARKVNLTGLSIAVVSAIAIVGGSLAAIELEIFDDLFDERVQTTFTTAPEPAATDTRLSAETSGSVNRLEAGDKFADCPGCPEMIVLPNGSFNMGTPGSGKSEQPVRTVELKKRFAMSRTEITVANWKACLASGGCLGYDPSDREIDMSKGSNPVGMIPFVAAESYASWLSKKTSATYRLPSEAEWEYAARAGTSTRFSWGNQALARLANCAECGTGYSTPQIHEVARYQANAFGLFDMHGSLWEWTQDCVNRTYAGAPISGEAWLSGDCSKRIIRGGGYRNKFEDIRSANRNTAQSDVLQSSPALGFRVVREID